MTETAVLIPHYNNPNGLRKSISSIREKIPVDIIVVDDGSTTVDDLDNLSPPGIGEITVLRLEENQGIERALNYGLAYLVKNKYQYVARLDCGDLCVEGRIEKQRNFLKENKDVKLLGSYVSFVNLNGKEEFVYKVPTDHDEIKKKMYLKVMFIHPSVMFHVGIVDEIGYYPENYKSAEDYAYFFSIVKKYRTSNIPEVLVATELNPNGISITNRKIQIRNKYKIIKSNFYFGIYPILGLVVVFLQMIVPREIIHQYKRLRSRSTK